MNDNDVPFLRTPQAAADVALEGHAMHALVSLVAEVGAQSLLLLNARVREDIRKLFSAC
jgi:hypothetical protein